MIYNAEGEILKPFIPYKGVIPNAVLKHFEEIFNMLRTDDGDLDRNSLSTMVLSIKL